MAIDTNTLIEDLEKIFGKSNDANTAATEIANALEKWIKTATVQVTAAPSTINVTGSPSAMTNATSISISGSPAASTGGIT